MVVWCRTRRLARDGRARDHQPRREVAAVDPAGLPDPLDGLREPRAGRDHLQLQEEHAEAADEIRNAIASVRHKLPVEMREPILQRIDPSAQPIMQLALSAKNQSHAEISRLAEDVLSDRFAPSTAWRW
jgi:hypothetical protein